MVLAQIVYYFIQKKQTYQDDTYFYFFEWKKYVNIFMCFLNFFASVASQPVSDLYCKLPTAQDAAFCRLLLISNIPGCSFQS